MFRKENWERALGFTMLELIISLMIVGILVVSAVPVSSRLAEKARMRSVAQNLTNFFYQARSETVKRNRDHFIHITEAPFPAATWQLALYDSDVPTGSPVLTEQGSGIYMEANIGNVVRYASENVIQVDRIRGKLSGSGNLIFSLPGSQDSQLKLIYVGVSGRVRVCGKGEESYGYPSC